MKLKQILLTALLGLTLTAQAETPEDYENRLLREEMVKRAIMGPDEWQRQANETLKRREESGAGTVFLLVFAGGLAVMALVKSFKNEGND